MNAGVKPPLMSRSSPSRATARLGAITSLGALFIMALMVLIAGAATPEYSHISQYISELGARGAPHEWSVRVAGFLPVGLLLLGFCCFAYIALPRSRGTALGLLGLALFAAGYLVAAAFPCDLGCRPSTPSTSQLIHNAGGLIGYLLAPASLFALAREARSWPGSAWLPDVGYGAAGLALLGFLTLSPDSPVVGLSQRLLEASVLVWSALCGRYLARRGAMSERGD